LDSIIWREKCASKRRDLDQYVFASRAGLGFAVNDQRKNREAHRSHRNGLTNSIAMILSMIPLRRD